MKARIGKTMSRSSVLERDNDTAFVLVLKARYPSVIKRKIDAASSTLHI